MFIVALTEQFSGPTLSISSARMLIKSLTSWTIIIGGGSKNFFSCSVLEFVAGLWVSVSSSISSSVAIGAKRLVEINNCLVFFFSFFPEELEEDSCRLALTIVKSSLFLFERSVVEKTESLVVRCIRALPLGTVELFLSSFRLVVVLLVFFGVGIIIGGARF